MTSMQSRIRKGMILLDEISPDWHWRIKLNGLDIQDVDDCVLGRCFHKYENGLEKLGLQDDITAYEHGFLDWTGLWLPTFLWKSDFSWLLRFFGVGRKLTNEWKKAILEKRLRDEDNFLVDHKLEDVGVEIG